MNLINQKDTDWYKHESGGKINIENIEVSDGGLLLVDGNPNPSDSITLKNVCNKASTGSSKYLIMDWPTSPMLTPTFIWDNSGITMPIIQGPNEAAFRLKASNAQIHNVKFKAHLDAQGNPWKQIVQLRSSDKEIYFEACEFIDGWVDIGRQKIAQPDGSSIWDMTQSVKLVVFNGCTFHRLPPGSDLIPISRQPGVSKIIFQSCRLPDGKLFSKTI